MEALLAGEAERLTRRAIEAALGGDAAALKLCLERIAPKREAPVYLEGLPPMSEPRDLPAALGAIVHAVAAGELTPGEGERIGKLLGEQSKALELLHLERRIVALESVDAARDEIAGKLDELAARMLTE